MHAFTELVIENLRDHQLPILPMYEEILDYAVSTVPPPFGQNWFGRRYFELARSADWFANSLVANAALEGYGSRNVWAFSNKVSNQEWANAVRVHALDESRHSTMFVTMLKNVFPNMEMDETTSQQLDALQPKFSRKNHPTISYEPTADAVVLNEIVGIQITEIRALVLQLLLRPVLLAYTPVELRDLMAKYSSILIRDECRHIQYSAEIVENVAKSGGRNFLYETFINRLREFNELTMVELEREKLPI